MRRIAHNPTNKTTVRLYSKVYTYLEDVIICKMMLVDGGGGATGTRLLYCTCLHMYAQITVYICKR